jgi:FkbM family methyltransferase
MSYQKFHRMLMDTKVLHGEFHGQHLCDGYKAGAPGDAAAVTRVLNMLGDDASRIDYLTILFGEPVQVWQNWCRNLYNHLEYMDYATIAPGDVIVNCGVLGGSEIPLFLAALDGRGKLVNIDPFGYDHVLDHTRQALAHHRGIEAEVRVAAFNKEGTIRLPVWHGMAVGGMAGKSLAGFPEQDFPCKTIDAIARELALERVDYIKMDTEGAEIAALEGAAATIERHRPQLAISIYHERSHYWQIPLMLQPMCRDYRFYVKHYHYTCAETLIYAVPQERTVRPRRDLISITLE